MKKYLPLIIMVLSCSMTVVAYDIETSQYEDTIGFNNYLEALEENYVTNLPAEHRLKVPFVSQAPFHNWGVPFNEACEEASIIMVDKYYEGVTSVEPNLATELIRRMVSWEQDRGYIVDISTTEMSDVAYGFYGRESKILNDDSVNIDSIKRQLANGKPVIIPIAGREIGNPYYTYPGPAYHVIVITGYDKENFYINDPGTRFGHNQAFKHQVIMDGIHDWNGSKSTISTGPKSMIILDI